MGKNESERVDKMYYLVKIRCVETIDLAVRVTLHCFMCVATWTDHKTNEVVGGILLKF